MFAISFDDFKRKMLAKEKPVYLKKIITVMPGTDDYETYMNLYVAPENQTVYCHFEDDLKTVTFFTIVTDQTQINKEVEAYYERIRTAERTEPGTATAFV